MNIFNILLLKKDTKILEKDINNLKIDQYAEIGKLVKDARIKLNLSLEDLSEISKIPSSTINAIENNIKEHRPSFPFLRSILLKLEECLYLKKNILIVLADKRKYLLKKNFKKNYLISRFDLINSWKGSVLYLSILLFSLFILNRYFILNINVIEIKTIEEKII